MIAQGTRGNGTLGQVVQTACELTRVVYNSAAMEPRIQYARTADGVSIAFWTLGEGMPLVHMPDVPFSHIEMECRMHHIRRWYQRLSEKRRLVRYDGRGTGLSERNVADYSLGAHVLDLEAVVASLGLDRFALLGLGHSGPVATAYAACNPERVSHLVLWCSYTRASDYLGSALVQTVRATIERDWGLYTESVAHAYYRWSAGQAARQYAALVRESITRDALLEFIGGVNEFDVTNILRAVASPTLVLHRRSLNWFGVEVARGLASGIPGARLAMLEGESMAPYLGDSEAVLAAIDEFLGEGEEAARGAEPPEAGAFRTVLFTDVEGSTALTQRLGDAKAREVLRTHDHMVREALRAHGGAEVKTMGDGFMASFSSATRALECAIAMQRAFAQWNADVGAQGLAPLHVRIGLNAGEPIAEEEDLFGTAVILAARVAAKAEGGEILASDVVRQLVAGKGFLFSDRGDVVLRGFEDPVRLYEVRWREDA